MDSLLNIRTFVAAARLGSFAAAARSFSISPSVVSKRIGQLEHELRVPLFQRTTRELRLTEDGARLLPRCMKLIGEYDEIRDVAWSEQISGHLRVEAPGSVTAMILGPIFCDFLAENPGVELDLRLTDRLDNPLGRNCDLTIGTRPSVYEEVRDYSLMPYPCAAYASRAYVERYGEPGHPQDLSHHRCLVSLLHGKTWHFYGEDGDYAVTVKPRLAVNDAVVLREAVSQGLGIAVLPSFLVERERAAGTIDVVLGQFRPPPMWIKAQVPKEKAAKPSVVALLSFLQDRLLSREPSAGGKVGDGHKHGGAHFLEVASTGRGEG